MNGLFEKIGSSRVLAPELREEITRTYGGRGIKALAALDEQRVKKYLDFFVVKGATSDHIVDEDFCTCGDFLFRERECWHLLAVRLALATGTVVRVMSWYQEEWKMAGTGRK